MDDAGVVEDERRPGLEHREAHPFGPVGGEDARLAALDPFAAHQDDRDEVDTVAVRALGRRPADAVGGVDAELMRLDEPGLSALQLRRHRRERLQHALPRCCRQHRRVDRLEPALEAAVQGVVFDRLPVRSLRHEADVGFVDDEAGMAAAPVAAAVAQVGVGRQLVPRRPERVELGDLGAREAGQAGRRENGAAMLAQRRRELLGRRRRCLQRGSAHPPWRARAKAAPCASAASLASATARFIGARPQLVHGNRRSFGT